MVKRPSKSATPTVAWRDGVHITATPLWCDSVRVREVCFASAADAVPPLRHGQLIGTDTTLALLKRTDQKASPSAELAVPYGRPFTLGTIRLELFRTGHALGSAGLWVDTSDRKVVYAGSVCPRGQALGGSADARAADTLVISAAYGSPTYRFPDPLKVSADVLEFASSTVAGGGTAVLLVSSALKGLDVAHVLASAGLDVAAQRRIHHVAQRVRTLDTPIPPIKRANPSAARPAQVLLWLVGDGPKPPALPSNSRIALVSGEALRDGACAQVGADVGFPWSNRADYNDLIEYIESSGAREVFLTHRFGESLARALDRSDRVVRALGPPKQMSLF